MSFFPQVHMALHCTASGIVCWLYSHSSGISWKHSEEGKPNHTTFYTAIPGTLSSWLGANVTNRACIIEVFVYRFSKPRSLYYSNDVSSSGRRNICCIDPSVSLNIGKKEILMSYPFTSRPRAAPGTVASHKYMFFESFIDLYEVSRFL